MPGNSTRSAAHWVPAAEDILLTTLREARANGLGGDNNFQPAVYTSASNNLHLAGYEFSAEQCKNRWNRFKSAHKTVTFLRGLSGFGWDDTRKVVTASDDVWKNLLYHTDGSKKKKYNDYNYFRNNAFLQYDLIGEILGGNTAALDHVFSSTAGGEAAAPVPGSTTTNDGQGSVQGGEGGKEEEEEGDEVQEIVLPGSQRQDSAGAVSQVPSTPTTQIVPRKRAAAPTPPATPPPSSKRKNSGQALRNDIHDLSSKASALVTALLPPDSPVKPSLTPARKRCYSRLNEDGLSPYTKARARRVFRNADAVNEYLSFGDDEDEVMARNFWLHQEMDEYDRIHRNN
ncbi:unnamed protein product [Peniophora sp. CBMAI 1063]|nr:unnamed protein product [Peniophora sp. CBMAI 1063]